MYGTAAQGSGVAGSSDVNGVLGVSSSGIGVYGISGSGLAGRFDGAVFINGNFTATGIKSAAVPHPDGSLRRLYCVESPESWFEDFGEATLVNGRAEVSLDPDFAAIVRNDSYHVFLTPYGECQGLYVARRSRTAFEVREHHGGSSTLQFSYRIVAKRKDIAGPRLEKVSALHHPHPALPQPVQGRPGNFEPPAVPRPPEHPALPQLPDLAGLPGLQEPRNRSTR